MKLMNIDLYSGYEGETEVVIELQCVDGTRSSIRTWSGFFDRMMNHFEPQVGGWTGIARHYHMLTGWVESDVWTDPRPSQTLAMLEEIRDQCSEDGESIETLRAAFASFLREAVKTGARVSIREE